MRDPKLNAYLSNLIDIVRADACVAQAGTQHPVADGFHVVIKKLEELHADNEAILPNPKSRPIDRDDYSLIVTAAARMKELAFDADIRSRLSPSQHAHFLTRVDEMDDVLRRVAQRIAARGEPTEPPKATGERRGVPLSNVSLPTTDASESKETDND